MCVFSLDGVVLVDQEYLKDRKGKKIHIQGQFYLFIFLLFCFFSLMMMLNNHVKAHFKKIEYRGKSSIFLSVVSGSQTVISYRLTCKIFQAFISSHIDNDGSQIMKIENSVSQKI